MVEKSRGKLKFAKWNAHSVLKKKAEIDIILAEFDLDVLYVTETWLDSKQV